MYRLGSVLYSVLVLMVVLKRLYSHEYLSKSLCYLVIFDCNPTRPDQTGSVPNRPDWDRLDGPNPT